MIFLHFAWPVVTIRYDAALLKNRMPMEPVVVVADFEGSLDPVQKMRPRPEICQSCMESQAASKPHHWLPSTVFATLAACACQHPNVSPKRSFDTDHAPWSGNGQEIASPMISFEQDSTTTFRFRFTSTPCWVVGCAVHTAGCSVLRCIGSPWMARMEDLASHSSDKAPQEVVTCNDETQSHHCPCAASGISHDKLTALPESRLGLDQA